MWNFLSLTLFCILLGDLSNFAVILIGKRELVNLLCLSSWQFLLSCDCYMALPQDAVGRSAVCDCAMS